MINHLMRSIQRTALKLGVQIRRTGDYDEDGLQVSGLNTSFLEETDFREAWDFATDGNREAWRGSPPQIRWRAYMAVWAARHGLRLQGDFVECGVFTGTLSMTVCKALRFEHVPKKFYLVDSYEGLAPADVQSQHEGMQELYRGAFPIAQRNFRDYSNAVLVKGFVPEILATMPCDRVAYLSIDLNSASAEVAAMEFFWDKLSPGACVLFDDYGWKTNHTEQHDALDAFAAKNGVAIATLPTHQGLLIKPP